MLTTKTLYEDPNKDVSYRCPKCDFCGSIGAFEYRLPGVSMCIDGHSRHYEVQVPTGELDENGKPITIVEKFDHEPSKMEIVEAIRKHANGAAKPKRRAAAPRGFETAVQDAKE